MVTTTTTTLIIRKTLESILASFLTAFVADFMAAKLVAVFYLARDMAVAGIAFVSLARILGWDSDIIYIIKRTKTLLKVAQGLHSCYSADSLHLIITTPPQFALIGSYWDSCVRLVAERGSFAFLA